MNQDGLKKALSKLFLDEFLTTNTSSLSQSQDVIPLGECAYVDAAIIQNALRHDLTLHVKDIVLRSFNTLGATYHKHITHWVW